MTKKNRVQVSAILHTSKPKILDSATLGDGSLPISYLLYQARLSPLAPEDLVDQGSNITFGWSTIRHNCREAFVRNGAF